MIGNQRVTWTAFVILATFFFFKFLSSSESNNKSWDQLTFQGSLPNFSRTCLDILLLINLNSDNKLLQGPFTLCVANNTLVIFSEISPLYFAFAPANKKWPLIEFSWFHLPRETNNLPPLRLSSLSSSYIIYLIPSFSLLFFTSIHLSSIAGIDSRNLHLV